MGRTVTVALVCLLAAGVVVAGGVGGQGEGERPAAASGDAAAATDASAERATAESDRVSVAADDSGVNVGVSLDWGGISIETDGDGGGEGRVTHGAIDGEAADAGRAGACAVGFGEADSPLDLAFDGGNSSFELAWAANATSGGSADERAVEAGEVVEECGSSSG